MIKAAFRRHRRMLAVLTASASLCALAGAAGAQAPSIADRRAEDEVVYFLLPDRFENGDAANDLGGYQGDRLATGFDPTSRGYFHGGDIAGLTQRLDYIQGLGATAVWVAPIFANKPVQGPPGQESAAYHGYWITDFTRVDPHFGTNAEFAALVEAAHARGMKVYMDIVANHTADVIRYRECPGFDCDYRWAGDYPYQRRGGLGGAPINDGFRGDGGPDDFSRLTRSDYAYSPYVPEAEREIKTPAWLNDPIYYHNRGDSDWYGQSALDGDFSGLDDLFTEHPRVVQGMIDIYAEWIRAFKVDGFRIDTARHVDPAFWRAFVPAMLETAREVGVPDFHIFGEVYGSEPAELAVRTRVDALPSVLDFAFQRALKDVIAGQKGPIDVATVYAADPLYEGGAEAALRLPTFTGNHDMGRLARFILNARPEISDDELLGRVTLAHAMTMLGRGVPTLYYGDEQGFTGDGDDQRARQDMFPTQVAEYADDRRVGRAAGPFDTSADLYVRIAEMSRIRHADARLRRAPQIVRRADREPGVLALSRLDATGETLVVFNTSTEAITVNLPVDPASAAWTAARGTCPATAAAPGALTVSVGPLDYVVCATGARP